MKFVIHKIAAHVTSMHTASKQKDLSTTYADATVKKDAKVEGCLLKKYDPVICKNKNCLM